MLFRSVILAVDGEFSVARGLSSGSVSRADAGRKPLRTKRPMKPEPKKRKKSVAKGAKQKTGATKPRGRSKAPKTSAKKKTIASSSKPATSQDSAVVKPSAKGTTPRKATLGQLRINIPPLLLEGDAPPVSKMSPSGPGKRYALGPVSPGETASAVSGLGDLPESYGTR